MTSQTALTPVTDFPVLPQRPSGAHKGTFGRVLIVAGSRGMTGAAALAGLGALRGGAGLVTVASPASVIGIVAAIEPSYLTWPLPDDRDGRISLESAPQLLEMLSTQTAGVIGPGMGRSPDLDELVSLVWRTVEVPLVIDADGLNALAMRKDVFQRTGRIAPRILTPHPGEFARLTGLSMATIAERRAEIAAEFAREHHVIVVLKGEGTVVTDGTRLFVNATGNSGMATGGTGDVLSGVIAALLAQQLDPFDAARLGVTLHGLAGDLAAAELSQPALIASDLPRFLGPAWQKLLARGL